ncbi:MAG: DUF6526 family protein [Vicinamibacterales bacterium]
MPTQSYANHVHRPRMTALAGLFWVIAVSGYVARWRGATSALSMILGPAGLIGAVAVLIAISRAYTTTLQDRIIRLEMRVRALALLTPAQQASLMSLDRKRIAALRFASDVELPALLERAVREQMTPDQIKRAVATWVADHDRT